jgi:hypothetical protein
MVTMTPVDLLESCAQVVEKTSDGSVVGCRARGVFGKKATPATGFSPALKMPLVCFQKLLVAMGS